MSTHHYDKKFGQRKCLDCPNMIENTGSKKRCITCADANVRKLQRRSDEKRREKKRQQGVSDG